MEMQKGNEMEPMIGISPVSMVPKNVREILSKPVQLDSTLTISIQSLSPS